jgi:hypothetical protein
MGVPSSAVGYISATTGREDHEVHKGHVVAFGEKEKIGLMCRGERKRGGEREMDTLENKDD